MSLAYWCVLAGALLPYLTVALAKGLGSYDNAAPRAPGSYEGVSGRLHGAHANGFEAFPAFAVAVLVASGAAAHAVIPALDGLAVAWLALRLSYVGVYAMGWATLRSSVWACGFLVTIAIFTMPAWHG